jgi:hypothetical protein
LVSKMSDQLTQKLLTQIDAAQQDIEVARTKWLMDNHLHMDRPMWHKLNLRMSILDIDLAEADLVMLAEFERMPFAKQSPKLLTQLLGGQVPLQDEVIPSFIYVMESLDFEKQDLAAVESLAEAESIAKAEAELREMTSSKDDEMSKKGASSKEKKDDPKKKLTAAEAEAKKKLEEELAAKMKEEEALRAKEEAALQKQREEEARTRYAQKI